MALETIEKLTKENDTYKYNLIRVLTRVRNYDKSLLLNQKRVNK